MRNQFGSDRTSRALVALGRVSAVTAALMLGACAQVGDLGLGGAKDVPSDTLAVGSRPANDLEKATEYWGKKVAENPRDTNAVLNYARNLKAMGRKPEALAALQGAYLFSSENREFLSEYGRLALDLGQVSTAAKILERADDPAKPDWRIVSARGTALAKQGDYKEAIVFFERARELAPGQASLMNNLAMAYTMDGQAEKAEQLLRQASLSGTEDPRVKQNLALVLGLQGKHDEAKGFSGEPGPAGDGPVAAIAVDPQGGTVPQPVGAQPIRAAAPVVAKAAKPAKPVAQSAAVAAGAPDDIIRAAIEADLTRAKPGIIPAPSALKRKPTTVANADGDAPTLRPAKP